MSTTKAASIARELTDNLTKRLAASFPYVSQGLDTSGNAVITLSGAATPIAGGKNAVIRVRPITGTARDSFGNATQPFCPDIIDLITEANSATATDTTIQAGADVLTPIADILSASDVLNLLGEIARKSTAINWYITANGTLPSIANIPSTPSATFNQHLYWGTLNNQ